MQSKPQYGFHTRHPTSSSGLNSRQTPGTLDDFTRLTGVTSDAEQSPLKVPPKAFQMYWWIASTSPGRRKAGLPSLPDLCKRLGGRGGRRAPRCPGGASSPRSLGISATRQGWSRIPAAKSTWSTTAARRPSRCEPEAQAPRPLRAPGTRCRPPHLERRGAAGRTAEARTAPGEGGRAVRCPRGCGGAAGG